LKYRDIIFGAEKRDDVYKFVRKIRAKDILKHSIYSKDVSTLYSCHFQSYSNGIRYSKRILFEKDWKWLENKVETFL